MMLRQKGETRRAITLFLASGTLSSRGNPRKCDDQFFSLLRGIKFLSTCGRVRDNVPARFFAKSLSESGTRSDNWGKRLSQRFLNYFLFPRHPFIDRLIDLVALEKKKKRNGRSTRRDLTFRQKT